MTNTFTVLGQERSIISQKEAIEIALALGNQKTPLDKGVKFRTWAGEVYTVIRLTKNKVYAKKAFVSKGEKAQFVWYDRKEIKTTISEKPDHIVYGCGNIFFVPVFAEYADLKEISSANGKVIHALHRGNHF